jgi:hypothetical protein
MMPLPAFEASAAATPSQLVSPTTRATRPRAPADSLFQQSSKVSIPFRYAQLRATGSLNMR